MAFDVLVRTFLADGLSAGLAKSNAALAQLGRSGPGARAGLRAAEGGLRALAFEAAGASGPMGRVAAGLLQLGGGNAAVLAAVAGIGLITVAYQALTKESREAAEEQAKLRDQIVKTAASRAAALRPETQVIATDVGTARSELERLDRERAEVLGRLAFAGGAGSQQDIEFGFSDRLRQIDADRAAFSVTIAQNRAAAVPAAKREADEAERALRAEAERLLLIKQSNLERDIAAGTLRTTIPLRGGGTGLPKLEGGLGPAFKPEKFPERELFVQDLEKATIKTRPEKVDSARLAAEAMALLGAMKQGGAAGILGAGAGIAADLGGIKGAPKFLGPLGIGLNVASGLVNLFDRSQERHTKQIVDALERLGKEVGLERVTLVFTGPDGHQTRKTLAELEAGDAVERVPGPVGATG